jgi:meiotic recombination protein REC8
MDLYQPINDGYDLPGPTGLSSDALNAPTHRSSDQAHSDSASAPQRRKARVPKAIPRDRHIELCSKELIAMNNEYLANMAQQRQERRARKAVKLSKDSALSWILGSGINGVGKGLGASHGKTPLADMFSGDALYKMITGISLQPQSQKRDSEGDESEDARRRVRPRLTEEDQIGRGADMQFDEGNYLMQGDDLETGREAPEGIEDISSAMPWNLSIRGSSISRGLQSGKPGSITGSFGRRRSRMASASPLHGRGVVSSHELLPRIEGLDSEAYIGGEFGGLEEPTASDEFELYGPAARVDTQTAAQSSWQKAALDRESNNFLDFIENAIDEKRIALQTADPLADVTENVEFGELLPPNKNSRVVAAQALLHVLTLEMKNCITVKQLEAYGPITLAGVN